MPTPAGCLSPRRKRYRLVTNKHVRSKIIPSTMFMKCMFGFRGGTFQRACVPCPLPLIERASPSPFQTEANAQRPPVEHLLLLLRTCHALASMSGTKRDHGNGDKIGSVVNKPCPHQTTLVRKTSRWQTLLLRVGFYDPFSLHQLPNKDLHEQICAEELGPNSPMRSPLRTASQKFHPRAQQLVVRPSFVLVDFAARGT